MNEFLPKEAYFDSEPIIAWRGWRISEVNGALKLTSITYHIEWEPLEPLKASCRYLDPQKMWAQFMPGAAAPEKKVLELKNHGPAPNGSHSCGIYGVKDPSKTLKWADESVTKRTVIGTVSLWGRVLQFESGYRAEFAYPKFLFVIVEPPKGVVGAPDYKISVDEAVEGLLPYGVPVETKYRHEIERLG